ncbi:MAG TPA: acetyl-CoA carboxylase biotin carboxylase subunit [Actinomycetota bacterium]|nr:acetyl-CoA carboxylase biotin carboxylase subunit [Actinomycetota bacterium]
MAKPRILIANRGEIAVRIIRTVRELGYTSIAVYSDADRDALHVEMADQAYRIGPAPSVESYLSIGAILDAAVKSKATMIHPGYGFLSERSQFARAVEQADLTFVGPPADAIETMGDKSAARHAAEEAGVPIVPGTPEPITIDDAPAHAERIGFPVLVKAAFGGGGRGMHVVRKPEDLEAALARAAREAQAYFGRPEVFLERYLDRAHHVEAQVFADTHGNVLFLGERDCSVQRRHQKLIEETPSPVVDAALRTRIGEASISLAKRAAYVNAGTIECIVDEDGEFYFLEMNTRLQVEHTVTEMVTGLDLVALQLRVALGDELDDVADVQPRGAAIQCRINAEDPARNFLPGPGRVTRYREPAGPFVRVDSLIGEGREIPADYDSMFAKVIVGGETRDRAIGRMLRALGEYRVEGVPTTIPLHRWILQTRTFRKSTHTTTWLEKALRDAELDLSDEAATPSAPERAPVPAELILEVDGRRVPIRIFDQRRDTAPKAPSRSSAHRAESVHSVVSAPMQGTILRVLVEPGQDVQAGDVVCILEAMKMENAVPAPREGKVAELPISEGQVVQAGDPLVVLE